MPSISVKSPVPTKATLRRAAGAAIFFLAAIPVFAQVVTIVAGTGRPGFSGDGGPATAAMLDHPCGLALDGKGNLYIADQSQRIRKVTTDGRISTFAGNGIKGYSGDGGPATEASMNLCSFFSGIALDAAGNVFIADSGNRRVRRVASDGVISTVIAGLSIPVGPAIAPDGKTLYIADLSIILKLGPGGDIGMVARDLYTLAALAVDSQGDLYATVQNFDDAGIIVKITPDGMQTSSDILFTYGGGLTADSGGNVFFADTYCGVGILFADGTSAPVANSGKCGSAEAPRGLPFVSAPSLSGASAVAVDAAGDVYIAGSAIVLKISPAPAMAPIIRSTDVTNAASSVSGITPGGIVTLTGSNFTNASTHAAATRIPLPKELAAAQVMVDGFIAPLFSVTNVLGVARITFQVPYEVTGHSASNVSVTDHGKSSSPVNISVLPEQPGIFGVSHANSRVVYSGFVSSSPAYPDEAVAIYATGLGPVYPVPGSGEAAPSAPPSVTTNEIGVTVGGISSEVLFSGLAPGLVGINQVNVRIPLNLPDGDHDLIIRAGAASSPPAKVPVHTYGAPVLWRAFSDSFAPCCRVVVGGEEFSPDATVEVRVSAGSLAAPAIRGFVVYGPGYLYFDLDSVDVANLRLANIDLLITVINPGGLRSSEVKIVFR